MNEKRGIDDGLSFKYEERIDRNAIKNTKDSEEITHVSTEDLEETNTSKVLNDKNDNNTENEFSYKINSLEEASQSKISMVTTSRRKSSKYKNFEKLMRKKG